MTPVSQDFSPSASTRSGDVLAAGGMLAAGAVFGSVGTLGASFLPLMAATALSMPVTVAGQSVSGSPGAMAAGVVATLGLPLAFVALREGAAVASGFKMWKAMLNTKLGRKAVEITDSLGGMREAAMVTAVSASGVGALVGTYAATGSTSASMLAMAAAGTAAVAATSALSGLRQERVLERVRQAQNADRVKRKMGSG